MKFTAALALIATAASAAEFGSVANFFGKQDDFLKTHAAVTKKFPQQRVFKETLNKPSQQLVSRHVSGAFGSGRSKYDARAPVLRQASRRSYSVAAAPVSYGGASYYRGDSILYGGDVQPTYTYSKGSGYGIYGLPRKTKTLIANDGYRVKRRTQVGERVHETVNAKCVLMDPDYKSDVYAVFKMSQSAKDKGTLVWGEVAGLYSQGKYDLSINALGDLRDGCDSVGGVFNPFVSKSGYGHWKEPEKAPGALGSISNGVIDVKADVDLSGSHSIIGRSVVITSQSSKDSYGKAVEGRREGCCTIGLAAGEKPVYKTVSYKAPAYQAPYQPYGAVSYGGYGGNW